MPSPLFGQITVTGTPQALSPVPISAGSYVIKAPKSNALPIFVGGAAVSTNTGFQMDPGDTMQCQKQDQLGQQGYTLNVSDFFVVGTASDKCVWLASP